MSVQKIELEDIRMDEVSDDTLEAVAGAMGATMGQTCPYETPLTICC
jgi:hypothetical protein